MAKKAPPKKASLLSNAQIGKLMSHILVANSSSLLSRSQYLNAYGENRDLYKTCGYPENLDFFKYKTMYEREGLATRVINVMSEETWSEPPEVYEKASGRDTPWERIWNELVEDHNVWFYLSLIDTISGIGSYGVLFCGFDDKEHPSEPVDSSKQNKLLYLQAFDQEGARIDSVDQDPRSPRYGLPVFYTLKTTRPADIDGVTCYAGEQEEIRVHWTRCVHVFDGMHCSRVFGIPRLRPVYNTLLDIQKIKGGSSEMLWAGGFPGFALETPDNIHETVEFDPSIVEEEITKYLNGMKRWMGFESLHVKSLAPQVADPTAHFAMNVGYIAATIGCPLRVLMGSEAAHLASEQDSVRWNGRIGRRRVMITTPRILNKFIETLTYANVLPPVKKRIYADWKDLNSKSDEDKANYGVKITQALLQYVTSGVEKVMPLEKYLVIVLHFSEVEAKSIVELVRNNKELFTEELWETVEGNQDPNMTGTDPAKKTGSSGKRNNQSRS